jgi:hypothetical protein
MSNVRPPTENYNKLLHIYKGKCFTKPHVKKYQKVIVFDLDETLGSFSDLNILWTGLEKMRKTNPEPIEQQKEFNRLLDLYPEFLRYGIMQILDYLVVKKKQGECDKVYIYTNNICTPPWVSLLSNYLNFKLTSKSGTEIELFDKAICAFKINNKVIELSRTTKNKTYNDFIKCTLLPRCTEVCFLDNTYYPEMLNEKVYYIQPLAYIHNMNTSDIIDRFLHSTIGYDYMISCNKGLREFLYDWFEMNGGIRYRVQKTVEMDAFVAQKIMYHVKEFFYFTQRKNKSKKNKQKLTRLTRKNMNSPPSTPLRT